VVCRVTSAPIADMRVLRLRRTLQQVGARSLCSSAVSTKAVSWTCLDDAGAPRHPVGVRSSHGCCVIGSKLVLIGGERVARTPLDDGSDVWSKELSSPGAPWVLQDNANPAVAPPPRIAHAQCCVPGTDELYLFGGRCGITMQEEPLNDLWLWRMSSRTWTAVDVTGQAPAPRSFHKMVAIDHRLYVFGGCLATGRDASLHCFDTRARAWSLLAEAPPTLPGRGGAGFVASSDGTALFVVGGFCGHESNAVWRFVLQTGVWEEVLPEGNSELRPFSVSCGATLGPQLVFFGGEVEPSNKGHEGAGGFSDALVFLDGTTGRPLPQLSPPAQRPQPRGWADCGTWGADKMVVYGGLTGNDEAQERLADTWLLEVSDKGFES